MIVAGIGARAGVAAQDVVSLIEAAMSQAKIDRAQLSALATIDVKAREPGLVAAARHLGLEVLGFARDDLPRETGGVTSSPQAQRLFGVSSVSEAAALAGAGAGSELILPRIKSAAVTCALARSASP